VGFNKRKLEDQRRQAAEKEAAARRATDAQVPPKKQISTLLNSDSLDQGGIIIRRS
jgi:hypothetical protein